MTLRLRLVLTTLAGVVPLLLVMVLGIRYFSTRMSDELIGALVWTEMSAEARRECEAFPAATHRTLHLPSRRSRAPWSTPNAMSPLRVDLFDRSGISSDPNSQPIKGELLQEVLAGATISGQSLGAASITGPASRQVLVALPWTDGPCALALVGAHEPPHRGPPLPIFLWPVLLPLIAVLVGIGPLVRRTRALTLAVRRWKADQDPHPPIDASRDELGELSRAFGEAAEMLTTQQRLLTERQRDLREFVENVSHDLATPLTVLQGHLTTMADAPNSEVLKQSMNEVHYLGALLGSLSLSAKFEADANVVTEIDLCDVVERVVARHRNMAKRLGLTLESAVPGRATRVLGDPTFTEQALTNLVGNALRYNREGGNVAVVLDIDAGGFTLRVLDDGAGLSDESIAHVLERGQRGDSARTRDPMGQGLGLSIVARVATAQHWTFRLYRGDPIGLVAELSGPLSGGSTHSAT